MGGTIDCRQNRVSVPRRTGRTLRRSDLVHIGARQRPLQSGDVVLDLCHGASAHQRDADRRVGQNPPQRQVGHLLAPRVGYGFQILHNLQVALEILLGEYADIPARPAAGGAPVVVPERGVRGQRAGEQAERQRAVHHHSGALFQAVGKISCSMRRSNMLRPYCTTSTLRTDLALLDLLQREV